MNVKYLNKLEYNKILDILSTFCKTYIGKDICFNLKPCIEKDKVSKILNETNEAISIRYRKGTPPISAIEDIHIWLKSLDGNNILSTKALLELARILKMSRELYEYFYSNDNIELNNFAILQNYFSSLYTNISIEQKIFNTIIDENTISDNASTKLGTIRRNKRKIEQDIKDKLNNLIHSNTYSKYLQDPVVTIRNDRYVVPVKEEYRTSIKGFTHDMSSSGSTLFIEPLSVFDLNNQINNLKIEENIEIEKILSELTNLFVPLSSNLENNNRIIGRLDFIFAKANYSIDINGIQPHINDNKIINLIKAKHPLIDKNLVVPISISLGEFYSTLVITGPNTGGKTVTLKTVGLLTLMAMSGLNIPANENSSIYVFDNIFADIGDEQSIQDSLSTFSSHMLNIVDILKIASSNSLILVDELGSGTDPIEGSSLAISILEYLYNKNILTIATTHYPEIKNYALCTNGFENASQEFDVENLKPTYQLLIGVPGKSNAFAISKRLGLNENIINRASEFITSDSIQIEDILKGIYDNKLKIEEEKKQIDQELKEINILKKELEKDNSNVKLREKELIEKAKLEAREILSDAKETSTKIIREMNSIREDDESLKKLNNLRNSLNDSLKKTAFHNINDVIPESTLNTKDVKVGMSVYVNTLMQDATVLTLPDKSNNIQIQIGSLKTKVNINVLSNSISTVRKEIPINSNRKTNMKSKNASTEINVIGQTVDESIFVIDKFLDDSFLSNLETVRIVHGKGTGKLRQGIHAFLKNHPQVKSYRVGTFGEGEMGVTIVTLKK